MAIRIQKEDTRSGVQVNVTIPAALNEDLTAWAAGLESSVKHVVVEVLKAAVAENRKEIDQYKAQATPVAIPDKSSKKSGGFTRQSTEQAA